MQNMHILEKVSRAIGKDYGIKVTFSGTRAYTDCKNINLPAIPPEMLDEKSEDMLRGYCDHEIAHVLFSSESMLRESWFINAPKDVLLMTGVIEDIRVESEMMSRYAGAKINMERLGNILAPDTDIEHPVGALLIEGRRQNLNYKFDGIADLSEKLKNYFCDDLFERIAKCKSSMDSYNLALELVKVAKENESSNSSEQKSEEKSESEKGEKGESGEKGEKEEGEGSDSKEKGEESGEEKSKGSGKDENPEDESSENENKGDGSEQKEPGGDANEKEQSSGKDGKQKSSAESGDPDEQKSDDASGEEGERAGNSQADGCVSGNNTFATKSINADFDSPIEAAVSELTKKVLSHLAANQYAVYSTSYDEIAPMPEKHVTTQYDVLRARVSNLGAMKSKIGSMFNARVAGHWLSGKDNGRINNRALVGVASGRKDVFKERFECRDVDTAITFLVDFSGSMSSSMKIETAMATVVMFCEVLQQTKVKFEILGFTSGGPIPMDHSEDRRVADSFSRKEKLKTLIIKDFNEAHGMKIKRRISGWNEVRKRNNYDGESLMIALRRISARKERRKIIIVLSDGRPCGNVGYVSNERTGDHHLKSVTSFIENKTNVELIGIGYMDKSVKEFYKNSFVVRDSHNLPEFMLKELRQILKV